MEKPATCHWQYFATWRKERPQGEPEWVALAKAYAAHPDFDGLTPLWPPADGRERVAPAGGTPLPGSIPLGEPWASILAAGGRAAPERVGRTVYPLKLSLEGSAFVVRAETKMRDWADLHLLARWWVNGQPAVPPRSDVAAMIQLGRRVSYAKEMRIAAGWPDSLGDVKAGDKLGLQVLYSPGMARPLPKEEGGGHTMHSLSMREAGVATMPMLSNRIEFAVSEERRMQRSTRRERAQLAPRQLPGEVLLADERAELRHKP